MSRDDFLFERLNACVYTVWNQSAIAIVVDVADATLLQSEGVYAALEGVVLHPADRVIGRGVHAFHHRRENVSRRFVVLIGVDADGELVGRARRFEHALSG